jgi:diguanylate cyclase (GGDEF)-like protein/PAS domain S-box-containing protein
MSLPERKPLLLRWFTPRFSAAAAIGLGIIGLVGWAVDSQRLRVLLDGFPAMSVNTALSLVVCGTCLFLMSDRTRAGASRRLAETALILVGIASLLLAKRPSLLISSPHTALAVTFVVAGTLIHIRRSGQRMVVLVQSFALAASGVTLTVLVGYLFSIDVFYRINPETGMALHTCAGLTLCAVGLFNLRPDVGFAALVYSDSIGSHMLRTVLPGVGLFVLLISLFGVWGAHFAQTQAYAVSFVLILLVALLALGHAARHMNNLEALRQLAQEQYMELFEGNPDAILVTDARGRITQVNVQTESLCGYSRAELVGKLVEELVAPHIREHLVQLRNTFQQHPHPRTLGNDLDIYILCRDGSECPVNICIRPATIGQQQLNILSVRDMREHKEMTHELEQLSHVAGHDSLTGLSNRRLMEDLLTHSLASAERNSKHVAVCYCDLDGFKLINDNFGHQAGDAVLVEAAHRMEKCVRQEDAVARFGGDEFLIMLLDLNHPEDIIPVIKKLLERLAEPYVIEGQDLHLTGSLGVSVYPEHGSEANILISHADEALYAAKRSGKNQFRFFGT